jgi:hypothetical protein
LRILITNNTLAYRSGSELYVRDIATALLKRGHSPIAFSTVLGEVARELRDATIPVIDSLDALTTPPDIIHGQHHVETMMALLHFSNTPAIYVCHGWLPWEEAAPRFPRILRYVAVDYTCRDRLVFENAIPEERIDVLLNFVDLERFSARAPLPLRPQRALLFSNRAGDCALTNAAREACQQLGIELDVIGIGSGNVCSEPEAVLERYDLVFAKGRSALEAMAVGAAVIVCDAAGVGGMVTSDEFDRLRPLNFGIRTLREPVNREVLAREVARYDPRDAAAVSARVRASAGRELVVDELVKIYEDAIANFRELDRDFSAEQLAASEYLRSLSPILKDRVEAWRNHIQESDRVRQELEKQLALKETEQEGDRVRQELEKQLALKETELSNIKRTLGWRLLSRFGPIKHRLLVPAYKKLRKLLSGNERLTHNRDSSLDL